MPLKKNPIWILIIMILSGTGLVFPVSDIQADTQGEQDITFSITIDESLKEKNRHTVTVSDEQVNQVGENGILVIENFSEDDYKVYISEKQMQHLARQNATIQVQKGDITINIPVATVSGNQSLRLIIERLEKDPSILPSSNVAVGAVYDITLEFGDQIQNLFDYDITLSFPVLDHENQEDLQVYYLNEDTKEWELIGGEYKEAYIHAATEHFSIFALFDPEELAVQGDTGDKEDEDKKGSSDKINNRDKSKAKDDPKNGTEIKETSQSLNEQNDQESNRLPKTATNTYNFIAIGIALLLLGGLSFFLYCRFKQKTIHERG